jgi:MoaA/NifB/PqqE/SkfB family radical SAM enzyme
MKLSTLLSIAGARLLRSPTPIAVGFELTHLCNLACEYCDRHTRLPDEMTFDQIIHALDELRRMGMREVSLDGGEPLAHPRVEDVVDWLVERGIVTRMNTNGILVRRKARAVRRLSKVKISLDGPPRVHDRVRGARAFERALDGARAALDLGVSVEFTCVVGRHNVGAIEELIDIVTELKIKIIFQPARESLFLGEHGPGEAFRLDAAGMRDAFDRIERRKRSGDSVLNGWASLRHFRRFPEDQAIPCAAGWINVTMDPEGNLYHCGQINRRDKSNNVVRLGADEAFRRLPRAGCEQCWCARVVEENYAWGGRFDMSLQPPSAGESVRSRPLDAAGTDILPASLLVRKRGSNAE